MDLAAANKLTNDDWIAGLKAGRSDLTSALHTRIRSGLAAAFAERSDVGDSELDDFAQDAVIRVLDRLDSFNGDSALSTWAMAIAVRLSLTAMRRRQWKDKSLDALTADAAVEDASADPGTGASARDELLSALRSAIDTALTPRQRQAILSELEGIPQVVIAEHLQSTPGALYKMTHDARKKLRDALDRAGFDAQSVSELLASPM